MSRKRTAALGAGALSALLAGGIALAPMASATVEDSAFAISASGLIDIEPKPYVSGVEKKSEISIDLPQHVEPVLSVGILNAEAKDGWAQASTAKVRVGLPGAPVIEATLIEATCDNLSGSTQIVGLTVGGDEMFPENQVPANTALIPEQLEGIASITLNKQVEKDGALTVTALSVDVLSGSPVVGDLLGQSIDISSATCTDGGEPTDPPTSTAVPTTDPSEPTKPSEPGDGDNGDDDGDEADENGNAPVPTPQPGHLDVTG